jgi:hypothetical protein
LKNLVTDRPSPITVKLAQKSDKDNVFKLMDANVSRGQLKNLVTDRPSPITVKLAQKSDKDNVFKLMDANVSRGQLKNLVTDRPSPITVKLAQKQSKGVPVHVNPVLMRPTGAESEQLGLKLRIGPDDVEVEKKKTDSSVVAQQLSQKNKDKAGVPVLVDPALMKPTGAENDTLGLHITVGSSTDIALKKNDKKLAQKAGVPVLVDPALMKPTGAENASLGLNMRIGPDEVSVMKKPVQKTLLGLSIRNPVENPPFNNWSVNEPSPPHQHGMIGNEDLEQRHIIIDGVDFNFL